MGRQDAHSQMNVSTIVSGHRRNARPRYASAATTPRASAFNGSETANTATILPLTSHHDACAAAFLQIADGPNSALVILIQK